MGTSTPLQALPALLAAGDSGATSCVCSLQRDTPEGVSIACSLHSRRCTARGQAVAASAAASSSMLTEDSTPPAASPCEHIHACHHTEHLDSSNASGWKWAHERAHLLKRMRHGRRSQEQSWDENTLLALLFTSGVCPFYLAR